jgi:N-acetylmuramoyl-L-alanine amidase
LNTLKILNLTSKNMSNLIIYINAGHGNFVNGKYLTFPSDGKYYHFKDKNNNIVHSAYEGQTNRMFANKVFDKLKSQGFEVVKTYQENNDLDNISRCSIANTHFMTRKAKNLNTKGLWVSFHSNAFANSFEGQGTAAEGIELWTSPGDTLSDKFATIWANEMKSILSKYKIPLRTDLSDNDIDKEANFTELVGTLMPAVLIENLFFTNLKEAKLLLDADYQNEVVNATVEAVLKYIQYTK